MAKTKKLLGHKISRYYDKDESTPSTVIFRPITMEIKQITSRPLLQRMNIFYKREDQPQDIKIKKFIDSMLNYPESTRGIPIGATSPLDLNCKMNCFIVFYLSGDWDWQFESSGGCVTTKGDMEGKYGNLTHVLKDGTRIRGDNEIGEGCRLLYFKAMNALDHAIEQYKDGYNLHVELKLESGQRTKLIIDPDIRNPGGSGDS